MGPPENLSGADRGWHRDLAPITQSSNQTNVRIRDSYSSQCNAPTRRSTNHSTMWRNGFRSGAIDALRLAGRALPPETWATLDELARKYEAAGDD
jgi:hypothetical protein